MEEKKRIKEKTSHTQVESIELSRRIVGQLLTETPGNSGGKLVKLHITHTQRCASLATQKYRKNLVNQKFGECTHS